MNYYSIYHIQIRNANGYCFSEGFQAPSFGEAWIMAQSRYGTNQVVGLIREERIRY